MINVNLIKLMLDFKSIHDLLIVSFAFLFEYRIIAYKAVRFDAGHEPFHKKGHISCYEAGSNIH